MTCHNVHDMDIDSSGAGVQSIGRTLTLLRLLGVHQEEGLRLVDIVAQTGIGRPTAHRMLAYLAQQRFVDKDPDTRRYRLGVEAMQLGFASMKRAPLVDAFQGLMKRLARITGEATFLQMRQGDYGICLHREAGAVPLDIFSVGIGTRRLLGIAPGGLAIMATLDDAEIEHIVARRAHEYAQAGLSVHGLWKAVQKTRRLGYSETRDITTVGISGFGFAFRVTSSFVASISIGTVSHQLTDSKRRRLLLEARARIGEAVELVTARLAQADA
jgi:DNA-binding IclR family transcriptional regulator